MVVILKFGLSMELIYNIGKLVPHQYILMVVKHGLKNGKLHRDNDKPAIILLMVGKAW